MQSLSSCTKTLSWIIFAATLTAFAWFHQGGGWNQNVRFAMVRAMAEEGRFWIDSHLVYAKAGTGQGSRLVRIPVKNGNFTRDGKTYSFQWQDEQGQTIPVDSVHGGGPDTIGVAPGDVAASGDLSYFGGHFHPAKAPGGAFAALPAYLAIHAIERIFGMDPDDWWTLTLNAWLTSVFSVGLISALGCVIFFRLALRFSRGGMLASVAATLTFAFGTMFFPYGTMLYEHNIITVALLSAFYLLFRIREASVVADGALPPERERLYLCLAGFCAGSAALSNYIMAAIAVMMGVYLLCTVRRKGGIAWYALGLLVPFLVLCGYNMICFSTPFTTNYSYEDPTFKSGSAAFLGVFLAPQWEVLPKVLFSPFRGLFFTSPVLMMGAYGLFAWIRSNSFRAEVRLILSILAFFLLFILTFNGWHGGWAVGPRYLAPAVPFLLLPAMEGFGRFFRISCVLALISIAINLLVTAVDPQSPVGNAPFAKIEGRSDWQHNPLVDYVLPLFLSGQAEPLLEAQRDNVLGFYDSMLRANPGPAAIREQSVLQLKNQIVESVRSGKPAPLLLGRGPNGQLGAMMSDLPTIMGPISVNPMGVYEGWRYRMFPAQSRQTELNSFNAGEFLFGKSRWSLLPLLVIIGALTAFAMRKAYRLDLKGGGSGSSESDKPPEV